MGALAIFIEYGHLGPMIPQERGAVDPDRTEPIGERLKRQEELDRRERPLGELVPSEGTVDGRRLYFTTVPRQHGGPFG
jgi:hypothetical protein